MAQKYFFFPKIFCLHRNKRKKKVFFMEDLSSRLVFIHHAKSWWVHLPGAGAGRCPSLVDPAVVDRGPRPPLVTDAWPWHLAPWLHPASAPSSGTWMRPLTQVAFERAHLTLSPGPILSRKCFAVVSSFSTFLWQLQKPQPFCVFFRFGVFFVCVCVGFVCFAYVALYQKRDFLLPKRRSELGPWSRCEN